MTIREKLNDDLKTAMKSGETQRKDALRFIIAALKQVEIDTRATLSDEQVTDILVKESKKRRESIDEARKMGRTEMADQEQYELTLIETYLPQQMTREEIEAEVRKAIDESGAKSAKDMGSVMKIVSPRVKGKADGKLVNEVVKSMLG